MVVDDEPKMIYVMGEFLHEANIEVTGSVSVNQAIQKLSSGFTPDAILSDLELEDGTGIDLFNWIKGNREDLIAKFIFMTGYRRAIEEDRTLIEMAKKDRVFEKPFDLYKIRKVILEVISSR